MSETLSQLEEIEKSIKKIEVWAKIHGTPRHWQPISTAPKDGQNILAFKDGIMSTVRWLPMEKYWTLCVPGTFILYHDWDPTDWMPLPGPPKPKKGGDK